MALPPGQHAIEGFPRFGTHLYRPPPPVPAEPVIEIRGAGIDPRTVRVSELAAMPRRTQTSDFHCVSGWSATGLEWEGVPFAAFCTEAGGLPDGVTHVVLVGLDGVRSAALLDDLLADDVLVADRLDGRPLDGDHGAPVRLISPAQYGFVSIKHLCRVELHTSEPRGVYSSAAMQLLPPTLRARVWEEERHALLPGRLLRLPYRLLIAPIRALSARGARD